MKALLPLLLLAAPAGAEPLCTNAAAPGFAPGQARLAAKLPVGRAVEVALRPAADVAFAVAPPDGHRGGFGATVPLEVKAAGPVRLLLSARAWVDVVQGGAALPAGEHLHGPPCSGVAKIVAFTLAPGRYDVQLSDAEVRALVVKVMPEAVLPLGQPLPAKPGPR